MSRRPGDRWPQERIDRLVELVTKHRLEASKIAPLLGVSRDAVLGKARRLGLRWNRTPEEIAYMRRAIARRILKRHGGVPFWFRTKRKEVPGVLELYEGELRAVVDASRTGWWRFHEHYDRDGYCDNPSRGY